MRSFLLNYMAFVGHNFFVVLKNVYVLLKLKLRELNIVISEIFFLAS